MKNRKIRNLRMIDLKDATDITSECDLSTVAHWFQNEGASLKKVLRKEILKTKNKSLIEAFDTLFKFDSIFPRIEQMLFYTAESTETIVEILNSADSPVKKLNAVEAAIAGKKNKQGQKFDPEEVDDALRGFFRGDVLNDNDPEVAEFSTALIHLHLTKPINVRNKGIQINVKKELQKARSLLKSPEMNVDHGDDDSDFQYDEGGRLNYECAWHLAIRYLKNKFSFQSEQAVEDYIRKTLKIKRDYFFKSRG